MQSQELKKIIETLLFITDTPLSLKKLASITEESEEIVKDHILSLKEQYDINDNALQLREIAGGWQMSTRQQYSQWVRKLYNSKMTVRLTQAALETLCIIAYKQPITRAELEAVRGVDSVGPLDTLTQRRLITVVGRKEIAGRPLLYGTTPEFLRQFGLNEVSDLPKLDTFKIENPAMGAQRAAAELAEEEIKVDIPENQETKPNTETGALKILTPENDVNLAESEKKQILQEEILQDKISNGENDNA